jgi:hypothetical protein
VKWWKKKESETNLNLDLDMPAVSAVLQGFFTGQTLIIK